MSFILDALKKAESERGRAAGPVLVDVRIAPPRRQLPAWGWVLGAVLLANLVVLAWLMLRTPVAPANAVAVAGSPAAAGGNAIPVTPSGAAGTGLSASGTASSTTLPPSPLPPPTLPPSGAATFPPPSTMAPAQPARAGDVANLPTLRDLQGRGISLPPLLLNLHVYDDAPALRYVMLNGLRLAEGEFTPDGIKVEAITEGGVVLEARGQRFLLPTGN
jgi:general secretion pathway protein B